MPFDVSVHGLPQLLDALAREPQIAGPILEEVGSQALLSLVPDLADYPAPPAASTYRRTGTLGRLWAAARPEWQTLASGFEGSLKNATPYGPWVMAKEFQAASFRDRWQTDDDVLERHAVDIDRFFEAGAQRIADAIDQAAQS